MLVSFIIWARLLFGKMHVLLTLSLANAKNEWTVTIYCQKQFAKYQILSLNSNNVHYFNLIW